MTGNEYQRLAMRTCTQGSAVDKLRHGVFGLTAEAGEVAGIMQKLYQGHDFEMHHMKKELGDCLWMIAEICTSMGVPMDEIMELNIDKLRARYPNGFEAERSLHRKEGDV